MSFVPNRSGGERVGIPMGKMIRVILIFVAVTIYLITRPSCGRRDTNPTPTIVSESGRDRSEVQTTPLIELPKADQRLCTGVVILIDTSGSMSEAVRDRGGKPRPKSEIARDALQRIISYTGEWKKTHSDRILQLGVFSFSSSASPVLPMAEFNLDTAQGLIERLPSPGAGTAIGDAIEQGFKALYQSGCVRKFLVCITDGENTSGPPPDRVARALFAQTKGEVEMQFVAFDMSAQSFGFLSEVNGHIVEAADGEQLNTRLTEIYEKRILAEAMPAEKQ